MSNRAKQKNILKAIFTVQGLIDGIKKDKQNPFAKNRYATFEQVLKTVLPVLREVDVLMTQYMEVTDNDHSVLVTEFVHMPSNESLVSKMTLPIIPDPSKVASGITYYKRYMLLAQLALPTLDDDGVEASTAVKVEEYKKEKEEAKLISAADLRKIKNHSNFCDIVNKEIFRVCQVSDLSQIKHMHVAEVMKYVEGYKAEQPKENAESK